MALAGKEPLLSIKTAAIAAQRSIASDHAVAGDENTDMIVAIGRPDSPDSLGTTDCRSNVGIAARLAGGDLPQLAPDRFLKGRTGDIDRKVGRSKGSLDRFECALDELLQGAIVLFNLCVGKQPTKRTLIVIEGQPADPLARCRNQHLAKRAVEMGPANFLVASAVAPSRWSHSQPLLRI